MYGNGSGTASVPNDKITRSGRGVGTPLITGRVPCTVLKGRQPTWCVGEDMSTYPTLIVNLFNGRRPFDIGNGRTRLDETKLGPRNGSTRVG